MTTPSSQAGTRPGRARPAHRAARTPAEALRAAADFIESSGQRSGVIRHMQRRGCPHPRLSSPTGTLPPGTRSSPGWPGSSAAPSGRKTNVTSRRRTCGPTAPSAACARWYRPTWSCGGPGRAPEMAGRSPRRPAARSPRCPAGSPTAGAGSPNSTRSPGAQRPGSNAEAAPALPAAEAPRARRPRLPAADQRGPPGGCPAGAGHGRAACPARQHGRVARQRQPPW